MPTTSNPDTWSTRELPLLRELAARFETPGAWRIDIHLLVDDLGMSIDQLERATTLLEQGGYIAFPPRGSRRASGGEVSGVTPEGLRAVGQWPSNDTALERMLAALNVIAADAGADDDTRSRARKALESFAGAGRSVGIAVAAAVITGQIPGQ